MARKRRYLGEEEEVSYWRSTADVILALLFVVLLILVLLAMWLVTPQVDDEGLLDNEGTYSDVGEGYDDPIEGDNQNDNNNDAENNAHGGYGGHGGGGGDGGNGNNANTSEFTGVGMSEYNGFGKSAILVSVRDAETGRLIQEKDVTFTLHSAQTGLMRLFTYYPQQIQYDDFKTTEEGKFFLPEKIADGQYFFREMTEPKGYDGAEDTNFTVDRDYDWSEPLHVYIDLMPCQNVIRLQLFETDTHAGIENASFQIFAEEDIITADGTTRYAKGELVGTITTDGTGYAESSPLYLGKYTIHQSDTQKGYIMIQDCSTTVEKKNELTDKTIELDTQQTRFEITLTDELETNIKLADVTFELSSDMGDRQRVTTDSAGRASFTGLEKNANYTLRQVSKAGDYQLAKEDVTFMVDAAGYIEGAPSKLATLTNRTLRLEVGARDALLRREQKGYELTMYNANGEIVGSWNSTNGSCMFKGLEPGTYTVSDNRHPDRMTRINVVDTPDIQRADHMIWTDADTIIVVIVIVAGLAVVGVTVLLVLRRRRRKGKQELDG